MKITALRNSLQKGLLLLGLVSLVFVSGAGSAPVHADPADDACAGIEAAGGTCSTGDGAETLKPVITSIIEVLSIIVGAAAVIMIIVGGLRYVLANGDSNAVSGAKNTILYALVGLVIAIFAQVIVSFVFTTASTPAASSSEETAEEVPADEASATEEDPGGGDGN